MLLFIICVVFVKSVDNNGSYSRQADAVIVCAEAGGNAFSVFSCTYNYWNVYAPVVYVVRPLYLGF